MMALAWMNKHSRVFSDWVTQRNPKLTVEFRSAIRDTGRKYTIKRSNCGSLRAVRVGKSLLQTWQMHERKRWARKCRNLLSPAGTRLSNSSVGTDYPHQDYTAPPFAL